MGITNVTLTWTNQSVGLTGQRIESSIDDGATWVTVATVDAVVGDHTYQPGLTETTQVKYRIVSLGAGGVEVNGTAITLEVTADDSIVPVTDLEGEVTSG